MKVKAIVIKSVNGVIAIDGKLPWSLKEDMESFKACTVHDAVVMGRRTWEGLFIQPLPNRLNIVVSRTMKPQPGVVVVKELAHAYQLSIVQNYANLWVIGGADIYRAMADMIEEWYITEVNEILPSGLTIPKLDKTIWECDFTKPAKTFNGSFKIYIRRATE